MHLAENAKREEDYREKCQMSLKVERISTVCGTFFSLVHSSYLLLYTKNFLVRTNTSAKFNIFSETYYYFPEQDHPIFLSKIVICVTRDWERGGGREIKEEDATLRMEKEKRGGGLDHLCSHTISLIPSIEPTGF